MYQLNQYVMREGDPGEKFYLVLQGEAVAMKGDHEVHEYQTNDFFGELALIDG
jgi:cAMP-dependent protein kinase regulator